MVLWWRMVQLELPNPRIQQPHTLLFTTCSVGLHRWAAGYLDGPATHQRDTSHSLRHCYLQRLQGGADSHQVRLSKRTGGSCAWDRDNYPSADHPRYGSSLSVGIVHGPGIETLPPLAPPPPPPTPTGGIFGDNDFWIAQYVSFQYLLVCKMNYSAFRDYLRWYIAA